MDNKKNLSQTRVAFLDIYIYICFGLPHSHISHLAERAKRHTKEWSKSYFQCSAPVPSNLWAAQRTHKLYTHDAIVCMCVPVDERAAQHTGEIVYIVCDALLCLDCFFYCSIWFKVIFDAEKRSTHISHIYIYIYTLRRTEHRTQSISKVVFFRRNSYVYGIWNICARAHILLMLQHHTRTDRFYFSDYQRTQRVAIRLVFNSSIYMCVCKPANWDHMCVNHPQSARHINPHSTIHIYWCDAQ